MKRLLATLTLALVLSTALTMPALAEHYWQLKMSEPRATQQLRTFNVEYAALSTEASDQITLQLLQNGSIIGSQTTEPGGDSGVFTVTVPSDGAYTYVIQGTSSIDGDTQTTTAQTVIVTTPAATTVSVVSTAGTTGTAGAAGTGEQTAGTTAGANSQQGTVGEGGASDEKKQSEDDKDVLGAEDNQDSDNWSNVAIIVAVVVVLIAGYIFFYGEDKAAALFAKIFRR